MSSEIPTTRDSRFVVLEELGTGATNVFHARDTASGGEEVVVKVVSLPEAPEIRREFSRAARASLRVRSPFVVRTREVLSREESVTVVMERIDGSTLAELSRAEQGNGVRALPLDVTCRVAAYVLRGLSEIHRHGLVHRDVKADNVMIGRDGSVRLVDLGLMCTSHRVSSLSCGADNWIATAEWITGTPSHLPPEYFRLGAFDERGDLYALGIMLIELLTGSACFSDLSWSDLVATKLEGRPIALLPSAQEKLPQPLQPWLARLVAVEPEQRFNSSAKAFETFCSLARIAHIDLPEELFVASTETDAHAAVRRSFESVVAACEHVPYVGQTIAGMGEQLLRHEDGTLRLWYYGIVGAGAYAVLGLIALIALLSWPASP